MDTAYPYSDDPPKFRAWLFERVREIPGIVWDESVVPTHSTYQDWYVWGERELSDAPPPRISASPQLSSLSSVASRSSRHARHASDAPLGGQLQQRRVPIVTRLSRHVLRLERQYQLEKTLASESDPESERHIRFLQLLRLAPRNDGEPLLAVIICENPGYNELREFLNFGPNWYRADEIPTLRTWRKEITASGVHAVGTIPLEKFLDFAIGAVQCCEMLHQGSRLVHGELRGDAFGMQDGRVKLINFGSGVRAFEHGLTSAGWKTLSREVGVEYKLHFIAPEQTGRLPAAPDSRTDIYSLGIIFYNLLTGEMPFSGSTPLEIMQNVLSRRVPPVSTKRIDVPDALSGVIARMVAKNIEDRYKSAGGLKWDLKQIQRLLAEGDGAALRAFEPGSNDVNCYFTLPNIQIGRDEERAAILDVIDRVYKYCTKSRPMVNGTTLSRLSSSSSTSEPHNRDDTVSDGGSTRRPGSVPTEPLEGMLWSQDTASNPPSEVDVVAGSPSELDARLSANGGYGSPKRSLEKRMSNDAPRSVISNLIGESAHRSSSIHSTAETSLSALKTGDKFHRKGRTEIIAIAGVAGLGKSSLIQSIQPAARKQGYFAGAKFDQSKKTPFGPVLDVMASLFRQIFSESDVNTEFHHGLRSFVRPVWPVLCGMLSLPEWLLGTSFPAPAPGTLTPTRTTTPTPIPSLARRSSSPHKTRAVICGSFGNTTSDFLRTGTSAKSSRFMAIFLDVLRFLASQKFILLCLDDVQFADEESVELFYGIAQAKIPIAVILTYREHESLQARIKSLIKGDTATVTRITLKPLSEDQIAEYVLLTLRRSKEYVFPLVAVIVERTGGNPFFVREMLDACYRNHCIWYSWKDSEWQFELDKVFTVCASQSHGAQMNNDFIQARLRDLPEITRRMLAWASLLGNTFSFSTIKTLMGEQVKAASAKRPTEQQPSHAAKAELVRQSSQDAIRGLQTAIASYIVMPGEDDDHFAFCHDRYQQAASSLIDSSETQDMHFSIAQIMSTNSADDENSIYDKAGHICASINLIKERIPVRGPYRDILFQTAEGATESGGRSAGLNYFTNALALLQKNPWDDTLPDVSYTETLTLFTRAAEGYWVQGHIEPAMALLQSTFRKARNAIDKVPSYILHSRIMARRGDSAACFRVLKQCLSDLDIDIPETTWEQCDVEFHQLALELDAVDQVALIQRAPTHDPRLVTVGSVLCEILHAAFWTDPLFFYQLSLVEVRLNLHMGLVSTGGLGYVHLAACAIGRFGLVEYGWNLGEIGRKLINQFEDDNYMMGRGKSLYCILVGHFGMHSNDLVTILEGSLEASISAGDRMFAILAVAIIAASKLLASSDLIEIESFCAYGAEELANWQEDRRGGLQITAIRQLVRALQGKTFTDNPDNVMSDAHHDTATYLEWVAHRSPNPRKAISSYHTWQVIALFMFGHYEAAFQLDEPLADESQVYWSARHINIMPLYQSLSYMALLREDPTRADRGNIMNRIRAFLERLISWSAINDVNYCAWTALLSAQICEIDGESNAVLSNYELGVDCAELHGFTFEQGLINELYAEYMIRRKAHRPAKNAILDAVAAYRRISAFGKAQHLTKKHEWLLRGSSSLINVDSGCQTEPMMMDVQHPLQPGIMDDPRQVDPAATAYRTQEWLDPSKDIEDKSQQGLEALGLDMIDLAGILRSSQVLSSELQVDKLLAKMSEVIRQSTTAELCAIIIGEGEETWKVANVTDSAGNEYPSAQTLDEIEDVVGKQITLYSLRFKEIVFLPNIYNDDRFSNLPEAYRKRNPHGKAIIAMPILRGDDMTLGCVYLEGPPQSFSERNVTVLRLLVNSVSISIANAMLFKRVEKVSASNASMIESQKRALAQAREAEKKARIAEADALRSAKLKEEAIKAKQGFLANVSHELRTPLNGVIGMSELLKASSLSSEQEGYADSIRVCADTLLTVINDILDYSKLEAGKMQMFSVPLSLTETIAEVVRALSYSNLQKDLKTIMELGIDTGRDRPLLVMGDPVRLHQVCQTMMSF